jgi:hypothetical protein
MNNKDILKQYVNSGNLLPEYQVKKLNSGLLKSYLRKRLQIFDSRDKEYVSIEHLLQEYEIKLLNNKNEYLNKLTEGEITGYLHVNDPLKFVEIFGINNFTNRLSTFKYINNLVSVVLKKSKKIKEAKLFLGEYIDGFIDTIISSGHPEIFIASCNYPYEIFQLFNGKNIKWEFDDMLIKTKDIKEIIKIINEIQPDYFDKLDKLLILRIYALSRTVRVNTEFLGKRFNEIIDNMDIDDIYFIMKYNTYYNSDKDDIIYLLLKRHNFFMRIDKEMYEVLKYICTEPDDFVHFYSKFKNKH